MDIKAHHFSPSYLDLISVQLLCVTTVQLRLSFEYSPPLFSHWLLLSYSWADLLRGPTRCKPCRNDLQLPRLTQTSLMPGPQLELIPVGSTLTRDLPTCPDTLSVHLFISVITRPLSSMKCCPRLSSMTFPPSSSRPDTHSRPEGIRDTAMNKQRSYLIQVSTE